MTQKTMVWRSDVENIPKSYKDVRTVLREGKPYEEPVLVRKYVMTQSPCNQLIFTWWLPDEQRFNFYTKTQLPVKFFEVELPDDTPTPI